MTVIHKFNMTVSSGKAGSILVSMFLISPLVIIDNMDSLPVYEVVKKC